MFPPAESGATDVTAAWSARPRGARRHRDAAEAAVARGALAGFLALGAVLHHRRASQAMWLGHRELHRSCLRQEHGHRALRCVAVLLWVAAVGIHPFLSGGVARRESGRHARYVLATEIPRVAQSCPHSLFEARGWIGKGRIVCVCSITWVLHVSTAY
jgi:hypothetical protein